MASMTREAIAAHSVHLDMGATTIILISASPVVKGAMPVKMKTENTA